MRTTLKYLVVIWGCLAVTACGSEKADQAFGRAPAKVTDDGVEYKRNFNASVELVNNATKAPIGTASFDNNDSDTVFGCSEGVSYRGPQFVFYMSKNGEAFKMTFDNLQIAEAASSYPNLVYVQLAGSLLGWGFDPTKRNLQVQECHATIQRRGDWMTGTMECLGVTPLASDTIATMKMNFSCDIAKR